MHLLDIPISINLIKARLIELKRDLNRQVFKIKFFRMCYGGLWIKFDTGCWMRFDKSSNKGYIKHSDGGEFHESFKGIRKMEDYKWRFKGVG